MTQSGRHVEGWPHVGAARRWTSRFVGSTARGGKLPQIGSAETALLAGGATAAVVLAYVLARRSPFIAFAIVLVPLAGWLLTRPLGGLALGLAMILIIPSWESLGTAQAGVARVASAAAVVSLLVSRRFRPRPTDYAVALFVAATILGWLFHPHADAGRVLTIELTPVGFYLGARAINRHHLPQVMLVVLFAGSIGALTVLYEYWRGAAIFIDPTQYRWNSSTGVFRPGGIFGSPPGASTVLCLVILLGFGCLPKLRGSLRALAIISLTVCGVALFVTFTRAPLIALAVGVIVFLWLLRSPILRPARLVWFTLLTVVVLLFALPGLERISTFQKGIARPGTLQARESYWQVALPIATADTKNFVFGIGTGSLEAPPVATRVSFPTVVAIRPQVYQNSLHSQYVTTLVEEGVVGLGLVALLFLSALVPAARVARRARDPACGALAAGIVAAAIVMTVDTVFSHSPSFAMIMLVAGLAATCREPADPPDADRVSFLPQ
jgi:O-antigen ligase